MKLLSPLSNSIIVSVSETPISGCYLLHLRRFEDARGDFVKSLQASHFQSLGLEWNFCEQFYSRSLCGVLRGMHCQRPPDDHVKLVQCLGGRIFDAIVDLRQGSGFGRAHTLELSGEEPSALYVPRGVAHGFCALTDGALTLYNVTTEHVPASDTGVHWRSCGIDWPVAVPIVSLRDEALPPLAEASFFG